MLRRDDDGGKITVKPVRWSLHALQNLKSREIDREEVQKTLTDPEMVVPALPPRQVLMRRYFDTILNQEILIRLIIEETGEEIVVITAYKTSQIDKYLKGLKT